MKIAPTCALLLFGVTAQHAFSETIASATAGIQQATVYLGQNFTTAADGPWNNITFNFYAPDGNTTPVAAGTAFLLSQSYSGTPADLSNATAGYLDSTSVIAGGEYVFDGGLVLQPNTEYWLYENASVTVSGGHNNSGIVYFAASSTDDFVSAEFSANYLVAGDVVSGAPEPATYELLGCALPAVWLLCGRRSSRT